MKSSRILDHFWRDLVNGSDMWEKRRVHMSPGLLGHHWVHGKAIYWNEKESEVEFWIGQI